MSKSKKENQQKKHTKKRSASKKKTSDFLGEVKREFKYVADLLVFDLDVIIRHLAHRERTPIEQLQKNKLTKEDVLTDLKILLPSIKFARRWAGEIRKVDPNKIVREKAEEVLQIIERIANPICWEGDLISELDSKKRDLIYKEVLFAYRRANEHRNELEKLRSWFVVEIEEWDKASGKNRVGEYKLTVKETADILEVSPGRVTQLCTEGEIKADGKGKKRRIDESSVYKYLGEKRKKEKQRKVKKLGEEAIEDAKDEERDAGIMNQLK